MKKTILVILLTLALVFTGCSGGTETTTESAETSAPEETTEVTEAPAEPVELTWLTFETANFTADLFEGIIKEYEAANPNVTIVRDVMPSEREPYQMTLFSTGQLPDVVMDVEALSEAGALLPLSEDVYGLLEDSAVFKYDGEALFVPTQKQIKPNFYYNKDVFDANGLVEPKTWDEFLALLDDLKEVDGIDYPLAGGGPDKPWLPGVVLQPMLSNELAALGTDFPSKFESGELKFDGPEVIKVVEDWYQIINTDNGYVHPATYDFTYAQMKDTFFTSGAALIANGSWFAADCDKYNDGAGVDFNVGWFALPTANNPDSYHVDYSLTLGVSKDTEYPEEAQAFIKFILENKGVYTSWVKADGAEGVTKEGISYEKGTVQTVLSEATIGLNPVMQWNKVKGSESFTANVGALINTATQNIFISGDIQGELENLQKLYEESKAQ